YAGIVKELAAAEAAYVIVDTDSKLVKQTCLPPVKAFAEAALAASKGKDKTVVQLDAKETAIFGQAKFEKAFEFKPLIADIGAVDRLCAPQAGGVKLSKTWTG